jgi:hypothetical protein
MLWKATQQFNRFRDMIELISGIVFLATPHITDSSDTASKALGLVLRSDLMPNPKLAFNKKDLSYLAYSSLRFEELKVQIPVLSCYETRETKLKAPLWLTRRAVVSSLFTGSSQVVTNFWYSSWIKPLLKHQHQGRS